ncbi:hypothetical protein KIW84_013234 [Lathyrus oleraceus]|uniref:Uncharacterized protein n=1 Tax=Pisum sativum TaxID=3888 RepID=A0A9D5BJR9_PEA|nr:hypothetical protein KIW84_013234 [Pisum sativum]
MKLNGDEHVRKSKLLTLKYVVKTAKASQVWESEEASHVEGSKDDSNGKEMAFLKGLNIWLRRTRDYLAEAMALDYLVPKERRIIISFHKDSFRNKFNISLMATWDELVNERDFEKDEEQANLALMALTSFEAGSDLDSDFDSDGEDEVSR